MYEGKLVFAQLMEHLPIHTFRRIVKRYDGDYKVQTFSCLDQFFCMAFAQLTYRENLRESKPAFEHNAPSYIIWGFVQNKYLAIP